MAETKTTTCRLTVAKADKDEFKRVWSFVHAMEALFDGRGFFSSEESWRGWDDDDEDKKTLLEIEKELIDAGEATWDGHPNNDAILYEFIKRKWREANCSGSFGRIIFDCQTLIENCCDPDKDYLEFKPSIMHAERIALEKVEQIITDGEQQGQSPEQIIAAIRQRIEESKKEEE